MYFNRLRWNILGSEHTQSLRLGWEGKGRQCLRRVPRIAYMAVYKQKSLYAQHVVLPSQRQMVKASKTSTYLKGPLCVRLLMVGNVHLLSFPGHRHPGVLCT